jgi:hypothetical protein
MLGAILIFRLLDASRCIGDIGMVGTNPGAEQLETAAGAGRFDHRRLAAGAAILLGDSRREGIDRR